MGRSLVISFFSILCLFASCNRVAELEERMDVLSRKITTLEEDVALVNNNAVAIGKFLKGDDIRILAYKESPGTYTLELSDGTTIKVTYGKIGQGMVPILMIDENGNWVVSVDGGETFDQVYGADTATGNDGASPQIRISDEGYWQVSMDGGLTYVYIRNESGHPISAVDGIQASGSSSVFKDVVYDADGSALILTLLDDREVVVPVVGSFYLRLRGYEDGHAIVVGQTLTYVVDCSDVASSVIRATDGWDVKLTTSEFSITAPRTGNQDAPCEVEILLVSSKGWMRKMVLTFRLSTQIDGKTGVKTWDDYLEQNADNLLPDFSYAGYNHGENVPDDGLSLGYTLYDVTKYGAVPNDGKSDRQAFIKAYQAAIGEGNAQNSNAKAVLYFPEGEYILHTSADNDNGKSQPIYIRAGSIVLKGAGVDKTTLVMRDPNLPASDELWSSPVMIEFKHFSSLSELTAVTGDAAKGSFSVEVASTAGIVVGDWVCLYVKNNNPAFVASEVLPYQAESFMTDLVETGVQVADYHQVKAVSANTVTFVEPLMHAVSAQYGWTIQKYPHYERVGIEDLTFKGNAKADFKHHASWSDDGGYKPLALNRLANAWIRRVRFTSVSEACSIASCSNVTVYDVEINGNRGHAAIRSQGSSRVFIGKIYDHSDGPLDATGAKVEGAGQFHAVGVSKTSMGAVLWRNTWGTDACFESHASQPRATLFDACKGGWVQSRPGGDTSQLPNHLADLVIWNFDSVTPFSGSWTWWSSNAAGCKFMPPIIVGFHGEPCQFVPSQVRVNEAYGSQVDPESLYEAQMKQRLGYVPSWLNEIK